MEKVAIECLQFLDLHGNAISLVDVAAERLLLIFHRHLAWLPCQAHLVEVNAFKNEFDRRNVKVVVVSFAEPAMLARYHEHHHWSFPILADPERAAYRAFALERLSWHRVFSLATLKLYLKLFRKGLVRHDYDDSDVYQAGGDFLLDRSGTIYFAHRSQDPADRPSISMLLKAIDKSLAAAPPPELAGEIVEPSN